MVEGIIFLFRSILMNCAKFFIWNELFQEILMPEEMFMAAEILLVFYFMCLLPPPSSMFYELKVCLLAEGTGLNFKRTLLQSI